MPKEKSLTTQVGRLFLDNPVIIASGVCSFGEENVFVLNKVGGVVFKTVTLLPREGNPPPRVVDFGYGVLNSIGLENPGVEGLKEKLNYIKKVKSVRIGSFLGFGEEEFVIILEKLEKYKVFDAYEVNLSCPNVKKGSWFYEIKKLSKLLKILRDKTEKPLIAKLSPETDVVKVAELCKRYNYDGVTIANTYTGVAVNIEKQSFCLGNIVGGMSGPAIKPLTLRLVYEVKKNVGIDIVGSGGVVEGKDAVEYFLVGASAVEIGCGYFRDPVLPLKVKKYIVEYLRKKDVELKDIVGKMVS